MELLPVVEGKGEGTGEHHQNITLEEALQRIKTLEEELQCVVSIMNVMKEDLQIKDEQFEFLYSSIRARNEQLQQSRLHEDEILRARVEQLESAITERSEENIQLQVQLKSATKKLQLLNSNQTTKCYFDRLPDEIIHRIMNFMCSMSLSNFACVDRYIRSCALEDSLWMSRFQNRWGPGIFEREHMELNRISSSNSTDKLTSSNLPSTSLTRSRKWFRLYAKCRMIESNWKHFRCETHECRGHNGTVTCLVMTKERMISGSDDGSMLLWDLPKISSKQSKLSLDSDCILPPPALPLAQLVENKSSNWGNWSQPSLRSRAGAEIYQRKYQQDCQQTDDLMRSPTRIYKQFSTTTSTPRKLRSFHGHGGPVWCVDYLQDFDCLISGSYDQTIKMWKVSTQNCTSTLRGHVGWVSSLGFINRNNPNIIISSSWDSTLKIWDCTEGETIRTMSAGVGNALYCLGLNEFRNGDDSVVTGCRQSQIQEWSLETGSLKTSYLGHSKEIYSVVLTDKLIMSGSGDSTIKIWDRSSGSCVQTWSDHNGTVMTLQFDGDYKVVSGSYDKTVKVWDLRKYASLAGNYSRWESSPETTSSTRKGMLKLALSTISIGQPVFCLKFDANRLIVGSTDHHFKLFDFSITK